MRIICKNEINIIEEFVFFLMRMEAEPKRGREIDLGAVIRKAF